MTVILNDITQDNNKIMGDKSNETAKFHKLECSTEKTVYTFQSVVEAEQQNGWPQKKNLEENENPASRSNQEYGIDKAINRRKGVEIQPIAVGFEERA